MDDAVARLAALEAVPAAPAASLDSITTRVFDLETSVGDLGASLAALRQMARSASLRLSTGAPQEAAAEGSAEGAVGAEGAESAGLGPASDALLLGGDLAARLEELERALDRHAELLASKAGQDSVDALALQLALTGGLSVGEGAGAGGGGGVDLSALGALLADKASKVWCKHAQAQARMQPSLNTLCVPCAFQAEVEALRAQLAAKPSREEVRQLKPSLSQLPGGAAEQAAREVAAPGSAAGPDPKMTEAMGERVKDLLVAAVAGLASRDELTSLKDQVCSWLALYVAAALD
jgi:hypothetical protein